MYKRQDEYFSYQLGALQYRSVRFETEVLNTDNYQGNAVVNYTERELSLIHISGQMLEYGFDFMEIAFGNSQEMTVFVTELNTNFYLSLIHI